MTLKRLKDMLALLPPEADELEVKYLLDDHGNYYGQSVAQVRIDTPLKLHLMESYMEKDPAYKTTECVYLY